MGVAATSRSSRLRVFLCLSLSVVLLYAPSAHAAPPVSASAVAPQGTPTDATDPDNLYRPARRRTGVALGLMLGGGIAASKGYPNNASLIGDPNYYSASGLMSGNGTTVLLMGALADYLNFGFWFAGQTFRNRDWTSTGGGGGFRVEAFPLYSLVPKLQDLGVGAQFGLGMTKLDARFTQNVSSSATESFLGAAIFYDARVANFFGGHATLGPNLEYDVVATRAVERNGALLSLRFIFYGGP